eukprot:6458129-Pyramimonas_sp.AAC.1
MANHVFTVQPASLPAAGNTSIFHRCMQHFHIPLPINVTTTKRLCSGCSLIMAGWRALMVVRQVSEIAIFDLIRVPSQPTLRPASETRETSLSLQETSLGD